MNDVFSRCIAPIHASCSNVKAVHDCFRSVSTTLCILFLNELNGLQSRCEIVDSVEIRVFLRWMVSVAYKAILDIDDL